MLLASQALETPCYFTVQEDKPSPRPPEKSLHVNKVEGGTPSRGEAWVGQVVRRAQDRGLGGLLQKKGEDFLGRNVALKKKKNVSRARASGPPAERRVRDRNGDGDVVVVGSVALLHLRDLVHFPTQYHPEAAQHCYPGSAPGECTQRQAAATSDARLH